MQIENITQYPSSGERIVITEVSPSLSFTVNSPINVKITTVTQYFVNLKSPIPVYALINGSNETLSSGWYNANTNIVVENITYYPQQGVRYVITSIKPESFAVNNEVTVLITATKQYYVNLVSPIKVYALVNGENVTFTSGWYNEDTKIKIENITQYPAPMERIIIISINPQSTFVVKSPINVTINVVLQYFVKVISPIPVKACVNGTLENLNSSWFNKGTTIVINNYTYYVSNEEREVIVKISPSPSVTLSSPVTFNITTQKQYLVTINGVSKWYNAGSVITLSANVPFYEVGEFKGTYNVSPNAVIVVNGPINETLVETLNYPVVILLFTAVVLAIALAVFLVKYKLK
ncbi:hypothetical protein D1867_11970 [Acidianus infernus]|uniref:Thermopsin n=1 Tax=Acidianus infernus TaxID=12915 RepID=A0A6A9QHZ3_ACIIN|nr:hypothetical protein [Acidianus infernus]MUM65935.1 hypothetical protein [Acidianus infernus]